MAGGKRKDAPGGDNGGKKKRTGNSGKWKTPHHQGKQLDYLQPGDKGIWVTCARHQEAKASREVSVLFNDYLEKMYGIKDTGDAESEDGDDDDIEAAIQKEVAAIKDKGKGDNEDHHFIPMKMNVDCLLFFKTKAPVEPVEFARRICADAKAREPDQFKCRYVNRLTPVTVIGKASEAGLIEVARKALSPFFKLNAPTEAPAPEEGEKGDAGPSEGQAKDGNESIAPVAEQAGREYKPSTFAIRPSIRNHSTLKRDFVIQQTAALVDQEMHKVNLSAPDHVILIDIYQTVCGMSVVGGDWDELKKYNLSELYGVPRKRAAEKDNSAEKDS